MLKFRLVAGIALVSVVVCALMASIVSAQTGDKWNLAVAVKDAAAKLKPVVVSVETRFDKPRTGFGLWEYFRGARPTYGLYGTGFFYRGIYVITSDDLTEHLKYARVVQSDGQSYPAELLGTNSTFHVAVLQVNFPPGMTAPEPNFLDSDKVVLGMPICVVGRSLNGDDTFATEGIISAVRKETIGSEIPTEEYIQFDANYEFTFTGGPLADVNGNILGMVTMINPSWGINLNLAVPINEVLKAADKIIIGDERVPWFGAEMLVRTINIDMIGNLQCLPFKDGLYLTYIEPNSPADLVGLEVGDVIEKIDGKRFEHMSEFTMMKRRFIIGQQITIDFWRDCEQFQVALTILPEPEEEDEESAGGGAPSSGKPPGHP
ncbi:serine protease [bacterium]|nr:serine protease [bacterium]